MNRNTCVSLRLNPESQISTSFVIYVNRLSVDLETKPYHSYTHADSISHRSDNGPNNAETVPHLHMHEKWRSALEIIVFHEVRGTRSAKSVVQKRLLSAPWLVSSVFVSQSFPKIALLDPHPSHSSQRCKIRRVFIPLFGIPCRDTSICITNGGRMHSDEALRSSFHAALAIARPAARWPVSRIFRATTSNCEALMIITTSIARRAGIHQR